MSDEAAGVTGLSGMPGAAGRVIRIRPMLG